MARCGGTSEIKEPTQELREIVNRVKPDVETNLNKAYTIFEPVCYKTQVVAGINYFIKVKVDSDKYLHLRIYKALDQEIKLSGVKEDETKDSEIKYF